MLVKTYAIKLLKWTDKSVFLTIYQNEHPTEQEIENILIEYKDKVGSIQIAEDFRLHSNTLFKNI